VQQMPGRDAYLDGLLGMETFHTLSTLAHALFRYRLVSSFAQTPRVEAPTNEAGERAAPPLIGRPL